MERETISIDYQGSCTLTCLKVKSKEDFEEAILYDQRVRDDQVY